MSEFVSKFRETERTLERLRSKWNALPTPETRRASGIDFEPARKARESAAVALVNDAHGRHKIEETARVYLVLGPDGWEIDSVGADPLDGYDDGPSTGGCEHDDGLDEECEALAEAAAYVYDLPTLEQLRKLMDRV